MKHARKLSENSRFMKKKSLIFFFALFLGNTTFSLAEESIMSRVSGNIVSVYISASECTGILSPGPEQDIQIIDEYFKNLYPNGAVYWALPIIAEKQTNREVCITNLEKSLINYQRSLYDFKYAYPNRLQPPMMFAYRWRDRQTKSETATKPALPIYTTPPPQATTPDSRF